MVGRAGVVLVVGEKKNDKDRYERRAASTKTRTALKPPLNVSHDKHGPQVVFLSQHWHNTEAGLNVLLAMVQVIITNLPKNRTAHWLSDTG